MVTDTTIELKSLNLDFLQNIFISMKEPQFGG